MAKAEAAEQKALDASDSKAYEHAWREAGRLWERAAERESDGKRRTLYTANAERARAAADSEMPSPDASTSTSLADAGADVASARAPDPSLN